MTPTLDSLDAGAVPTPWRSMLLLSGGLHLLGFVLVLGLPQLLPHPAAPSVYVVDLVSLPGGPARASSPPPAAGAAPVKPSPPPAPKPEKAIKLPDRNKPAQPKKTPLPEKTPAPKSTPAKPEKTTETRPASAAATPQQPAPSGTPQPQGTPAQGASMSGVSGGTGAAGGGSGGAGAVAGDAANYYASLVQRNIESAWKKPIYPPTETGRRAYTTRIQIVLTGSGRVSSVQVLVPSGYEAMDRSVLEAVHDAMFPPFPSSLAYSSLPFTVEMVLTRD